MKKEDISGKKFNYLTAIKCEYNKNRQNFWSFKCDCGNTVIKYIGHVKAGSTKSCGCHKIKDITNIKYGKLTAIKFIKKAGKRKKYYWLFRCECGKEECIIKETVTCGKKIMCNNCAKEVVRNSKITHNMSNTRFYRIYRGILNRCKLETWSGYKKYGAVGIDICERWLKFKNFYDDMYISYLDHSKKHGEKNTTIDRINGNENYSPKNCRWLDYERQANNIKTNVFLEHNGEKKTIRDWEKALKMNSGTLWARLHRGWSIKRSIITPVRN